MTATCLHAVLKSADATSMQSIPYIFGVYTVCPAEFQNPRSSAAALPRWSPAVTARQRAAALPRCSRNAPPTLLIAPAPRPFPAPGSCGQGPKRSPRPASGLRAGCLPPQRCVLLELCLAASGRPCLLARCGCNSRRDQSAVPV